MDRPNSLPDSGTPDAVGKPLWDIKQAAEYFRVSESWIRRHLSELPHSRHGRLIRFDPDELKSRVVARKSLEPTRRLMPNNRYQRGGVYLRGKKKMWYGTYRLDTPEGRRSINIPLGTLQELPTKVSARDKLREKIAEMTKSEVPLSASSMKFAELVKRWEQSEGPGMGETTLRHYTNALRASVLPKWKDRSIDSIQREHITNLLNSQAAKYSKSSLRSMRLVLCMTLGWAERNGYIKRPTGWLDRIKLPRKTGGRKVVRTELEQNRRVASPSD